jgi:hypothetical protein
MIFIGLVQPVTVVSLHSIQPLIDLTAEYGFVMETTISNRLKAWDKPPLPVTVKVPKFTVGEPVMSTSVTVAGV